MKLKSAAAPPLAVTVALPGTLDLRFLRTG